ncbi:MULTISPECIES: hypothetical protein [Metabacillus]|uniref:Uncharacterized protein n=2 Tax=Metabacillus TaxID=2675233 RepID=A0A179T0M0_9BACI|nr:MULTISPECIES: hypothetical protein [Metabacillus]OAS86950.1 hypothetical protein A6K24_21050 [Metabacillus litoralis]QNF27822.1 hypothetical protein HUW50_10090 [Metabacillus sp. KUDC1714]
MMEIRIDTSSLTYTQFLILGVPSVLMEGAAAPAIQLEPGEYGFLQQSGLPANFTFKVTADGLIDYDDTYEGFLDGRGTNTLIVRGFSITLDARSLSHDLLPMVAGADVLSRERTHDLTLVPAMGYGFQPASGIVADFHFGVTVDGQVMVDERYAGFSEVNGSFRSTLIINGYRITIDGRALSHDLLPVSMLGNSDILPRERTNEFTYIPAAGYGFQPAAGIVADFQFHVTTDGKVVVDERYAGFAVGRGRTLTITGYRITIDGRALSHDLLPLNMLGNSDILPREHTNEFTYIPAAGYGFLPAAGIVADFQFKVTVDGQVMVAARYAGFASGTGRTLTIYGYKVTIDGRTLPHDLIPRNMLGNSEVLSRDRRHDLTYIPAGGYGFLPAIDTLADFGFNVNVDGQIFVDPRFADFASAQGRILILGRKRKRTPAQKVEDLCQLIGTKEPILPALAAIWQRRENGEPSRNTFEEELYTVFGSLSSQNQEALAHGFARYSEFRGNNLGDCFFDDQLANELVNRPLEKAEFASKMMHLGLKFAGQQLFNGSGGDMGPGQVRPWTRPPAIGEEVTTPNPRPWITAIRPDGSSTNEFGNTESFIAAPGDSVDWKGYQFAQTCRFETNVSGGIIAHCDRVHPPPGSPGQLFGPGCEGGNYYHILNDCLRIPSQRAGGSIRLRGFNFITPSVKVHLQSRDNPPLTPIILECVVWGDRNRPVHDEQGKVIADLRVFDWVDVPIPSEHPDRPGSPLAPGLYDIWISVKDPSSTPENPIVRESNRLVLRVEPNENVHFLLRSQHGRCIKETPGGGDDEIWWDAFVGHIVPNKIPLDLEGGTAFRVEEISRKPFPREPWEDMDEGESANYNHNIFGPGPFQLNGVVAIAFVGLEVDSEDAASEQLQGFWNAYFEAFKAVAEVTLGLGGPGLVTTLAEILKEAGLVAAKAAVSAAIAILAYIAAITLITMGLWAVWAPADLIALDIFYLDGLTAWEYTDSKKPLPYETKRQFGPVESDDNEVLITVTQRALQKRGNPGEATATWVQENQYDAKHDGEDFASYVLEFRLTRTTV